MDTREQIIKVASMLFLKYGLRRVSVDDICRELRISKKTFYEHFRQKKDLVAGVLDDVLVQRFSNKNFDPNLNIIDNIVCDKRVFKSDVEEQYGNFFYDLNKYYPDLYQHHCDQTGDAAILLFEQSLEIGKKQGMIRQDLDSHLMAVFLNIQRETGIMAIRKWVKKPLKSIAQFFLDATLHMVASEAGLARYKQLIDSKSDNTKQIETEL